MRDSKPELAVQPGAVDTHCHLFLLDREPADVVEAARAAGVDRLICVGIDPLTSARSLEGVFATAGMHPHDASNFNREAADRIEELLGDPRVVGVGECGLDFYRMHSPRQAQERCFRDHIRLASEIGKPIVVHVREAWPDALRLLDEGSPDRVVLHCFSGDISIARECAARGYWLSFAGNITYPKNEHLRAAAEVVDLERILVETDSPFLSPQDRRGRENEPANVLATIDAVARIREMQPEEIRVATAENARAAFRGLR